MKTLTKILTAALMSTFALGSATAQNKLAPTSISTETSIVDNDKISGVPLQRVTTGNDYFTLKIDKNFKMQTGAKTNDVYLLSLDKLVSNDKIKIGASYLLWGNLDSKDEHFFDIFATKKIKDLTAFLDIGKGYKKDAPSREYATLILKHPKVSFSGAYFAQGSAFDKDVDVWYFGYGAYHDKNTYAAIGNKISTSYGAIGIHGFKNFGELAFATKDRETGNTWIKSQTAFGDVSQGFYSNETFDIASDVCAMPSFFPMHFSPLSTKGNVALKLEYKKNNGSEQSEVMIGTNKTPVQIGLGVNTGYDGTVTSDLVVELYKELKLGKKFNGSVEYRYNNRTHESNGYVKMSYKF